MLTIHGNTKLAITQELAVGRKCYYNTATETVVVEDELEVEATKKAMKEHPDQFILFSPPADSTELDLVKAFVPKVKNAEEKRHLHYALRRDNPMAYFKNFINKFSEERNAWFVFKKRHFIELVDKRIEEINAGK